MRLLFIAILIFVWAFAMVFVIQDSRWTQSGEFCQYFACNRFNERGELASPSYSPTFDSQFIQNDL